MFLAGLVLLSAGADYPRELAGKVVKVSDGDTLTLLVDQTEHKIRLTGIDTPEAKQPFGCRAKQALSDKVFGRSVQIDVTDKDRYGRLVGRGDVASEPAPAGRPQAFLPWYNAGPRCRTTARP